jgi:hypothetical protein
MKKCRNILIAMVLASGANVMWGQAGAPTDSNTPQGGQPQAPAPAYGPDNTVPVVGENPPISGLDVPNLEPHAAPLSYLQAGAHFTESVDSNVQNSLGGSTTSSITDLLGSLELQRLWSHYDLALDYVGGVGYYDVSGIGLRQIEELGLYQKINWKRGQLGLRDAFSYQPEGTFGSTYGGVGTAGASLGPESVFFGGTALGDLGQTPRIMNLALADFTENLTPRSSVTAAVGYGIIHFLQNDAVLGNPFIGSGQFSAEVGYDRLLGRHDQGAIVWGFQGFNFSNGEKFHSNVVQLMWGHRISGRMDFLIGAGPQFTELNFEGVEDLRISAAGKASLRYMFPKLYLDLSYSHYITSGSGFFGGAESDIVRLSANRPITRTWSGFTDIGYSRNSRELPLTCLGCFGLEANVYKYGFAGAGVRRNFGREFRVFASYQFNYLSLDSSYCGSDGLPCNRISQRHVGTIGLDWTPRPIRID